jgi:hypothetical protein
MESVQQQQQQQREREKKNKFVAGCCRDSTFSRRASDITVVVFAAPSAQQPLQCSRLLLCPSNAGNKLKEARTRPKRMQDFSRMFINVKREIFKNQPTESRHLSNFRFLFQVRPKNESKGGSRRCEERVKSREKRKDEP